MRISVDVKTNSVPSAIGNLSNQLNEWLTTLDALQEANLALKHSVSKQAKCAEGDKDLLEALENFLTRSLNKDTLIALLRQDVRMLGKLAASIETYAVFEKAHEKLALDVGKMCEQFAQLKEDFESRFFKQSAMLNSASPPASARSGL